MAEGSDEWVQGRPRLFWMDVVKVALGSIRMTVDLEAAQHARKIGRSLKPWCMYR